MIKLYPTIKVSENKQGGFTLIEIILTLVIAAVVGAGLVQYLGSAFTQSSIPIQRLRQALELQQVMENITADYIKNVRDEEDLKDLHDRIINTPLIYGTSYSAVVNFIKFTGQTEHGLDPGDPEDLLKVTIIQNDSGDILTTLFSPLL